MFIKVIELVPSDTVITGVNGEFLRVERTDVEVETFINVGLIASVTVAYPKCIVKFIGEDKEKSLKLLANNMTFPACVTVGT